MTLTGNPDLLAIESGLTKAYERPSFLGLGFFVIHLLGERYGCQNPEATMLACSFDAVERRIKERGTHVAFFSTEPDAGKVADMFCQAIYTGNPTPEIDASALNAIESACNSGNIQWAPDGDEAFDDGSFVLQFDIKDRVRVIAFKRASQGSHAPETLRDLWMDSDVFYAILQTWRAAFLAEWVTLPKVLDAGCHRSLAPGDR